MRRREFITLAGVAAASWPLAARAQQTVMPVIGFLSGGSQGNDNLLAFREGLSAAGYSEGRNITIEYRWANGDYDQLPALAADLVRDQVAVIAVETPVAALAAKKATASIPIVFILGSDPVRDGLVASLNRPGANITGATFFSNLLTAKRLELLHDLVPHAATIGVLINPENASVELETDDAQKAASALALQLIVLSASTESDIEQAFTIVIQRRVDALLVAGDAFLSGRSEQIAELALHYAVPTCFPNRQQVVAGGLMSYGVNFDEARREGGSYVGRILKGEKPADLPVQQPTKFYFVINLKTANALNLSVSNTMQLLADEVIE